MAESRAVKRPRPFSLAVGVMFLVVGLSAVATSWLDIDAGAVLALALFIGGLSALGALGRRRAPT